jgi:hypothetical protein
MQEDQQPLPTYKPRRFCGVCRHFCDDGLGHETWCPVFTQEPVLGVNVQPAQARERLLSEELMVQVQINRKLARELLDARLELEILKHEALTPKERTAP